MKAKGLLVVISAPSGGGKTTVIREILKKRDSRYQYSISATTRKPRYHERPGKDYWFISEEEFKKKIKAGDFIEWAVVHGKFYGTPKRTIDRWLADGKIVFMDIDVQGGLEVKNKYQDDALLIFIMPPSFQVLEDRLRSRNTDSEEEVQKRLAAVPKEIEKSRFYDKVVVNNDLHETAKRIRKTIEKYKKELK